jgi:hypothetical protein
MKFAELVSGDAGEQATMNINFNNERSDQSLQQGKLFLKDLKVKLGNNTLAVENTSGQPLYVNLVRKGTPLVTDETKVDRGLQMRVTYSDMAMNPVDPKNLEQGSDFMMVARVTNNTFAEVGNIALTQLVPSGWEIRNVRLFEADFGIKESGFDYRDYRDDRVYTYFRLDRGETKTFVLILNAAYKGEFYQPPVWCEAMYTGNCYSRVPGGRVKVTGQKFE